jgi:hypothetical protein
MRDWMRRLAMVGVAAWIGGAAAAGAQGAASGTSGGGDAVARGKYLVNTLACHDCHTPAKMGEDGLEPDMSRALTGHPASLTLPPPPAASGPWIISASETMTAWAGPWGVSYARNLTPDKETGLGEWTEQQFLDTMRTGRRQGRGRQILPPMPWPVYKNLTDDDLRAVYAYLQSLAPVANKVPEPVIAEPPR